jgi:hypothetical protein
MKRRRKGGEGGKKGILPFSLGVRRKGTKNQRKDGIVLMLLKLSPNE